MNLSYGNDRASADLSFSKLETGGFPARAESSSDHGHDNETFDVNIRAKAGAGGWIHLAGKRKYGIR